MKTMKTLGVLAAGLFCSAGLAMANSSDTLADLVATGGSLTIGDKTFSGFSYTASSTLVADGFSASDITVTAYIAGGVDYLEWTGGIALLNSGSGTVLGDLDLGYTVTAASPSAINEIDQDYNGQIVNGSGLIGVTETVKVPGGAVVGNTVLTTTVLSVPGPWGLGSSQPFITPPQPELIVNKDISLTALASGNSLPSEVSISEVEQSFHQTTPDGGTTLALLGFALAGCGMLSRKQSK